VVEETDATSLRGLIQMQEEEALQQQEEEEEIQQQTEEEARLQLVILPELQKEGEFLLGEKVLQPEEQLLPKQHLQESVETVEE
jgi:hypothetical protein